MLLKLYAKNGVSSGQEMAGGICARLIVIKVWFMQMKEENEEEEEEEEQKIFSPLVSEPARLGAAAIWGTESKAEIMPLSTHSVHHLFIH